jgi:tRNA uridine 5-carboxymethylaminomethyl modification enzyme
MFTSRSEFRLALRADNADQRLTAWGDSVGLIKSRRRVAFGDKIKELKNTETILRDRSITPTQAASFGLALNNDGVRRTAFELLSYPHFDWNDLAKIWPDLTDTPASVAEQVGIEAKYAVYLDRQKDDVEKIKRDETVDLSVFDVKGYELIAGLSNELKSKLDSIRPRSISQARQIEGMTPAALALVAAHAKKRRQAAIREVDLSSSMIVG